MTRTAEPRRVPRSLAGWMAAGVCLSLCDHPGAGETCKYALGSSTNYENCVDGYGCGDAGKCENFL